jgi:hypothetical protein
MGVTMTSHVTATLPPPARGVVRVCAIGADRTFCEKLEEQLAEITGGAVKLIATLDRVPEQGQRTADAIVFNPVHAHFQVPQSIDRVRALFGEEVLLIAYLEDVQNSKELLECLEASGVTAVVAASDFTGLALYLTGLSHETAVFSRQPIDSDTAKTPLVPDPLKPTPLVPEPLTADQEIEVNIERPVERTVKKQTVCIGIIHPDPALGSYLANMLRVNKELDGNAQVQDTFYEIPLKHEVERVINVVVFDPEMSDFRNMEQAVIKIRAAFGQDVIMVAHSDAWKSDTRLRQQMTKAGIRAGIALNDLKGLVKLMQLLIQSDIKQVYDTFKPT